MLFDSEAQWATLTMTSTTDAVEAETSSEGKEMTMKEDEKKGEEIHGKRGAVAEMPGAVEVVKEGIMGGITRAIVETDMEVLQEMSALQ